MCGICCSAGSSINIDKFKLLLLLNKSRGEHATGITDGINIFKKAIPADKFIIEYKEGFEKLKVNSTSIIIGHTRKSTDYSTSSKDECAHPFHYDNIIGVHNGRIFNSEDIEEEFNVKLDVDSEAIFYLLSKKDLEETIEQRLNRLKGKYAVAWYNWEEADKLHLVKHDAELSYAVVDGNLYVSSDKEHLKSIAEEKDIKELDEDTLYTYDVNNFSFELTKLKLDKYVEPTKCTTYYCNNKYKCDICNTIIDGYIDVQILWEVYFNHSINKYDWRRKEVCKDCKEFAEEYEKTAYEAREEADRKNSARIEIVGDITQRTIKNIEGNQHVGGIHKDYYDDYSCWT